MDPRIGNRRHEGYVVYFNCGHACCTECALELRNRNENVTCPLCRAAINGSLRELQQPLPDAEPQLCDLPPTYDSSQLVSREEEHSDADSTNYSMNSTFPFPKGTCYLCPNEFRRGSVVTRHSSLTAKFVCCDCLAKPVPPCSLCANPCNHHDASGSTTLRNILKKDNGLCGAPTWTYTCGPCIQAKSEENGGKCLPKGATSLLKKMEQERNVAVSSGATSSNNCTKRRRRQ